MDIYNVFLGDSYGSLRHPATFRDYEKHPYGSWEQNVTKASYYQQQQQNKRAAQSRAHQSGHGKSSKDKCPFCKEQKKRPLVSYMRKRENKKHNESICEEDEEEEQTNQEESHKEQVPTMEKAALQKSQ